MKKIFLIFFLILSYNNIVIANTNVVFLDLQKILSSSEPGLSILNQLNEINTQNLNGFQNDAKDLKEKENKLISQKNILSEADFRSKANKLKLEIKNYNQNKKKIINDFNKLKIQSTNKFLEMINPIITNYSNEKSISMILQKKYLILGKKELDITNEIIQIINENINEFKVK